MPKSAFDLMQKEFEPLKWIVDGIVPEGVILVAGKPKSGKSWFGFNLALAAAMKRKFLDHDVVHCGALYLALEDTPRRMQKRMQVLLAGIGNMEFLRQFEYECEWPGGAVGAKHLDEYLAAHRDCQIVVVDVLKKIKPNDPSRTKTDYDKDYEAIDPWKKVAEKYRVTLILIHHTRKAQADDVFDEISGTLGLNGAVDQICVLKRVNGPEKLATLHMRGRDLEDDVEYGLELIHGWWTVVGSVTDVAGSNTRRRILQLLRDNKDPTSAKELADSLGMASVTSLTAVLSKMVEEGVINRLNGRYSVVPLN